MSANVPRKNVAVAGVTGMVGQRFLELLANHPTFRLTAVAASESRDGHLLRDVPWLMESERPDTGDLRMESVASLGERKDVDLVFSALPGGLAGPIETSWARAGKHVFTNARDHRMEEHVPLLIPEINSDHLGLARHQDTPGRIVANGNCTGIVLTMGMAPLHRAFGISTVDATSMQGLSGAGHPGVSALDVIDNILPFIEGEEEKLRTEPCKTLGTFDGKAIHHAQIAIRATSTRVPVREGHLVSMHVALHAPATLEQVRRTFTEFRGPPSVASLASAPEVPILLRNEPDRPQPRRDREAGRGMTVSVGRVRMDPDGRGVQLLALGSNTVRGAAGQSILNAEFAMATWN